MATRYFCLRCDGPMESHGLKTFSSKSSRRYRCLHCHCKAYKSTLDRLQPNPPSNLLSFSGNRLFIFSKKERVLSYGEKQRQARSSNFLDGSFCILYDAYFKH